MGAQAERLSAYLNRVVAFEFGHPHLTELPKSLNLEDWIAHADK